MQKKVVGLGLVLLAAFGFAHLALADDDSDRASLIDKIDRSVREIANKLSGFESQRDYGKADDALSYVRDVADYVSQLSRVKGSDSRANTMVNDYPSYISTFRDSVRYLKKLKELQFLSDGVADRCARDEADLQTLIRNYVGRPDEAAEAFDRLPAKGQEYGRTYSSLVDKLKDAASDFNSNASSARFDISVSSSDNWNDVKSNYRSSSERIVAYWKDKYSAVDPACKRLALGDKHPDIVAALDDLKKYVGTTKQTVTQLKKDFNVWLRDARKLREMTQQDHDALREVMCRTGGEYDMNQKVNELADRWASQISSSYGTILGQSDRLVERALVDKLKNYKGSKEVVEGIRANRSTLEKVKVSDLQGSNNPKIKVKLEYGTRKHADLQSSMCSSGYPEFEISSSDCRNEIRPGSGCRADCVLPGSRCMIVEIKPNSDRAKEEGVRQRDAYAAGLATWYARNKDELFNKYPKIRECERDGKLTIDTRPEIYDFCPSSSETKELGADLDGISSDISESE